MRKNSTLTAMVMHQVAEDRASKNNTKLQIVDDTDDKCKPAPTELGDAFDKVCATALFPKSGIANVVFSDGSNDNGIDFYRVFDDGSITIAQCKYDKKIKPSDILSEAEKARCFIKAVRDGFIANECSDLRAKPMNMPKALDLLFNAIIKICASDGAGAVFKKIDYYFFISSSAKDDAEKAKYAKQVKKEKDFVNAFIYAGDDITALHDRNMLSVDGVPRLDLGLHASELELARKLIAKKQDEINKIAKARNRAGEEFTPVNMFAFWVRYDDLVKAIGHEFNNGYGLTRMLADNVRHFINSTSLCASMKKTLMDEPQFFGAYNNGISVVCSGTEQTANFDGEEDPLIDLTNASIVNGGQTAANLYRTFTSPKTKNENTPAGLMLCTVIIVRSKEERKKISAYRNTQRAVKASDERSLDDDARLLQLHLEYNGCFLPLKRGKDCSDTSETAKHFDSIRTCGSIMRLAQVYAAFAVHQPIIGRNDGSWLLTEEPWFRNFVHGDYSQNNAFAASIASISILDKALDASAKVYKSANTDAETEGIRYLADYVLGIQADMLLRASSTNNRKKPFKEIGYDIPTPLSKAAFNQKYGCSNGLRDILSSMSLPRYDMKINHMEEDDIFNLLMPAKGASDGESSEDDHKYAGTLIDWLFKEAVAKSAYYGTTVKGGVKGDPNVLQAIATDYCDELMTYNYDNCEATYPYLKLLKPHMD